MQGFLVVTFRDQFGLETVRRFELNDGVGATAEIRLAHLYTRAKDAYDVISSVTDAEISNVQIAVTDTEFALVAAKTATSNVSDDGVLSVALVDGVNKKGTIRIPAPISTALLADGSPDQQDNMWTSLVGLYRTGGELKLSDGDWVDDTKGNDGILKTWRASRGRRYG